MATTKISSYRGLAAWQKARVLVREVYRLTAKFPPQEQFGLVSQMNRAAVSIPSNIAEGYGRGMTQEYLRFLRIARGSIHELDTQLTLAVDVVLCSESEAASVQNLLQECSRVLQGLIASIERSNHKS